VTSGSLRVGSSWTTDAPYRETAVALAAARAEGIACVEMEAAALYAYAETTGARVVCLAHITNTMATTGDDFDNGLENGVRDAPRGRACRGPRVAVMRGRTAATARVTGYGRPERLRGVGRQPHEPEHLAAPTLHAVMRRHPT